MAQHLPLMLREIVLDRARERLEQLTLLGALRRCDGEAMATPSQSISSSVVIEPVRQKWRPILVET